MSCLHKEDSLHILKLMVKLLICWNYYKVHWEMNESNVLIFPGNVGSLQRNFFFKFFDFSWRLITLQYYSCFCHTLIWISHGFTCAPHPEAPSHFPPYPIPLGHPSAPALSTLSHASNLDWWSVSSPVYDNIHLSMLFSQIIPPLPFPTESKSLLYICVSFSVSHIGSSLPSF